jgi:hypothetical protein
MAIRADRMRLVLSQFFGRYLVPLVAFHTHYVNLITLERDVRWRSTYIFVVGVRGAQAVAMNTANVLAEVDFTDLLFDKTDVAHIAGGIWAEPINLVGGIRVRAVSGRPTA